MFVINKTNKNKYNDILYLEVIHGIKDNFLYDSIEKYLIVFN